MRLLLLSALVFYFDKILSPLAEINTNIGKMQANNEITNKNIGKMQENNETTNKNIAASEPEEGDSEIDIGTDEGCVKYIVQCFPQCDSVSVQPVAKHYVASLKQKIGKGNPLWGVFNKEVIKSGILSTKGGRQAWLSAHKSNREQRFVKAPKLTKK